MKLIRHFDNNFVPRMPPTRGHDLKPDGSSSYSDAYNDAPHTGARLETGRKKRST